MFFTTGAFFRLKNAITAFKLIVEAAVNAFLLTTCASTTMVIQYSNYESWLKAVAHLIPAEPFEDFLRKYYSKTSA